MHGKVVVEFGRKVFLVDCHLWLKNKYGGNKLNRTRSSPFIHTKTPSVIIQGNITAIRYRNDVIRSVLRSNLGMMLSWDYAPCHAARRTPVMLVASNVHTPRWPANSLDLNPIDHLLDLLKRKVRAQPLQLNLRGFSRVFHQMFAAIPQHYIHRHILSMSTRYLAIDATPGGCTT